VPAATLPSGSGRRRIALAVLLAIGILSQGLILAQQLSSDPLASSPVNDARVYWQWAGDVASGRLVGATPFLSAPLYPYLVGAVRALGGGLAAVYVLQAVLHLAAAWLLLSIGERRFGFAAGVTGAALYLALSEPAYYTARILNCTLQIFVVVLLWERMIAVGEAPRRGRLLALGAVLGANVLANPTMLAAVPLVALWAAWIAADPGSDRRAGLRAGALVALTSVLAIAPATLHNWLACREFIPVSGQGGVTFYHGNAPGADGTYHAIQGISENRLQQNIDARTLLAGETDGSWGAASSYFFRKGVAYWSSDPRAALRLFARKLWFFVSGRNYGDIYVPELERQDGLASRLALAPLPTAWLTLPALLALAWLLSDPRRFFPEGLLLLGPLLTVAFFWYSPRYRIPAVPLLAALSGFALGHLATRRASPARAAAALIALLLSIATGAWNRWTGFDSPESLRAQYQQMVGSVLVEEGHLDAAERRFRAALAAGYAPAGAALADVLRRLGRSGDALEMLTEEVQAQPQSAYARRSLAVALAQAGKLQDAEREFRAGIALDPNDWEALSGLGNVLHALGHPEDAVALHRAAIQKNPAYAGAHYNLGFVLFGLKRSAEAEAELREALRLDPKIAQARWYLAEVLAGRGDRAGAIEILRAGLREMPGDRMLEAELDRLQGSVR
jgi:tetratricopeptide (TPR) repeat protein